jgi:hypothetical protein
MNMKWGFVLRVIWQIIKVVFAWLIILYVGGELLLLRWVDPMGAHRYYTQLATIRSNAVADAELGYVYVPFEASFGDWAMTYTADGRYVPATSPGSCDVAIVGDSVSMGHGVDDDETFANILAAMFPLAEFHNWSVNGYNIEQVAAQIAERDADVYVYLMINNDADDIISIAAPYRSPIEKLLTASRRYAYTLLVRQAASPQPTEQPDAPGWFLAQAENLVNRDDVLVFGFAGQPLAETVMERYGGIVLIPIYHDTVSGADPHPAAAGHEQIAESMAAYIEMAIADACDFS